MRAVVVLFGIVIVLTSRTATACTCGGTGTPCESYGSAAAVFVGTVMDVRVNERPKQVNPRDLDWFPVAFKFSVEQSYLGVAGTEVEVSTGQGGGDCGYEFKRGQRYLVYAFRYKEKLTTSICTRTKPFSSANEDLAFLGTLSSAAPGVTIYGSVTRDTRKTEPAGADAKREPLSSDVSITIEGESERKEMLPDAEGRYRVSSLPAGKYKVTLHLPETLTAWQPERDLTLSDRGCAAVVWYVTDNGRISGRVVNADGEPVARILVSLMRPGGDPKKDYANLELTNDEGQFSFSAVARGSYLIGVNHNRFPDPNDPTNAYPPSFYPGVIDQAQAKTITVGPGEKLNDIDIRIPSKRPASILTGSVVWSDDSPVVNAQLSVRDVTQGDSNLSYAVAADEHGQFKINGYVGQQLIIEARSNRAYVPTGNRFEPMERTGKLTVTLERPTQTVRIVITKLR